MQGENQTQREKDADALVERIKEEIARHGVYVIDEAGLELICSLYQTRSLEEKRMHVENFALAFGFIVRVSDSMRVVVFRNAK